MGHYLTSTLCAERYSGTWPFSPPFLREISLTLLSIDSPVQLTVREAAKDDVLCGYTIPKGTKIMIPATVVHFHPDIWGPDADKFSPERFLEEGRMPEQAKGTCCLQWCLQQYLLQFLSMLRGDRSVCQSDIPRRSQKLHRTQVRHHR